MSASVRIVDTKGFTGMCQDLAAIATRLGANTNIEKVITSEAGHVLERCVSLTGPRNYFRAKRRLQSDFVALKAAAYSPQSASGRRYRTDHASASKNGFLFYYKENRYPGPLWSQIAAHLRKREQAVAALGSSKKSWVEAGDQLGVTLANVPGYARSAVPVRAGPQGFGRKVSHDEHFHVEIENRSPFLIGKLNGERILQTAVNGRQKFFQTNLEKGALLDIRHAAQKYPGILVNAQH